MKFRGLSRGKVIPKSFFGVHLVSLTGWLGYTTQFPSDLGAGSVRMWDTGTTWRRMETSKGVWDYSRADAVLAVLAANGVTNITFTLGQPPLWATGGIGPATGSFNPNPPTNIQDWRDYVTAMVVRYGSIVTEWEIWNEIDLAQFWAGSNSQMVQLTQEAATIIKSLSPAAKVIGANTSTFSPQISLPYMEASYAYTDIDATHLYGTGSQPEFKGPLFNLIKAGQRSNGISRPIWNTEYTYDNYYLNGVLQTGDNNPMPPDMAASYVARLLMMNWLFGFERCYFYVYDNFGFNNIRLMNDAMTAPSKAGRAFSYISSLLSGGTLSSFKQIDSHFEAAFTTSSGRFGRAFWCADDASATVDLSGYSYGADVEGTPIMISASYLLDMSPVFTFN